MSGRISGFGHKTLKEIGEMKQLWGGTVVSKYKVRKCKNWAIEKMRQPEFQELMSVGGFISEQPS